MGIGERILYLRKATGLTQEEFANRLRINKGTISNLEKGRQKPSEQLIRLICLEFVVSEDWLKTGEGEMFISPEEALKNQMARFGEQAVVEAYKNIMKERGLFVAAGRPVNRSDTGDPELDRMVNTLYDLWAAGDEDLKGWLKVQFRRAFPDDVIEEVQKKQKATQGQASAG